MCVCVCLLLLCLLSLLLSVVIALGPHLAWLVWPGCAICGLSFVVACLMILFAYACASILALARAISSFLQLLYSRLVVVFFLLLPLHLSVPFGDIFLLFVGLVWGQPVAE